MQGCVGKHLANPIDATAIWAVLEAQSSLRLSANLVQRAKTAGNLGTRAEGGSRPQRPLPKPPGGGSLHPARWEGALQGGGEG